MTDTDIKVEDAVATEEVKPEEVAVVTEEPVVVEPVVEEPKTEEPVVAPVAPAGNAPKAVGTDQMGRQLYEVKCSDCGKATQVPFNPTGGRPVYCRDCYMKHKNG